MGRLRRAGGAFVPRASGAALLVAVLASLQGAPATSGASAAAPEGPSVEALIARGILHSAGSEMRRGLEELRAAVRLAPGHELARRSLAVGLLRSGRFAEAEEQFAAMVGEELTGELASGALSPADMPDSVDPDALLGLATSVHYGGRTREAERLYRAYAALVGPMSREAGRAYYRLHELATGSDVLWLDADAELSKALAVDPNVETAQLLPGFTDPGAHPELEPYLRPIALSESRADTTLEYDALPLLSRWAAPGDTSDALAALAEGRLRLEILVTGDGRPVEVAPITTVSEEERALLEDAVAAWWFTPAEAGGAGAPAWILFGEEGPEEGAEEKPDEKPDEGTEEEPESAAGEPAKVRVPDKGKPSGGSPPTK